MEIHGYVVSTVIWNRALHPYYAATVGNPKGTNDIENQVLAWMGDLANAPIEREQATTDTATVFVQRYTNEWILRNL